MRRLVLALLLVSSLSACSAPSGKTTVTVFAASSLTESFTTIAHEFEHEHPGVEVVLNFGGSSSLAQQIVEGAPADVFAAASPEPMTMISVADTSESKVRVFASNTLELAVPRGNPGGVTGLRDLARPELLVAQCAAEVPCGEAARRLLADAGVVASVDSFELDVKAVLTRIELGEVDAGLVYVTDVRAAGTKVEAIHLRSADASRTEYPIVSISSAPAAGEFVRFVLSPQGQQILVEAGFDV